MNVILKRDSGREVESSGKSRCPMSDGKGDEKEAKERGNESRIL